MVFDPHLEEREIEGATMNKSTIEKMNKVVEKALKSVKEQVPDGTAEYIRNRIRQGDENRKLLDEIADTLKKETKKLEKLKRQAK
jgi:hypothetical protein